MLACEPIGVRLDAPPRHSACEDRERFTRSAARCTQRHRALPRDAPARHRHSAAPDGRPSRRSPAPSLASGSLRSAHAGGRVARPSGHLALDRHDHRTVQWYSLTGRGRRARRGPRRRIERLKSGEGRIASRHGGRDRRRPARARRPGDLGRRGLALRGALIGTARGPASRPSHSYLAHIGAAEPRGRIAATEIAVLSVNRPRLGGVSVLERDVRRLGQRE